MNFKKFIQNENFANFGFEDKEINQDFKDRSPNFKTPDRLGDKPIKIFGLEYLTNIVAKQNLGDLKPKRLFFDQIQWGENVGAIRLRFGTKYDVMMERLSYDLLGNSTWVMKNVFNLNREYFSGKEKVVAEDILKELNRIHNSPQDSPISDYNGLQKLVVSIANRTGAVVNDPLFLEEVLELNDDEYIIKFGLRGFGLQAPDQQRVEQVQIHIKHHKKRGVIQIIETNVESSLSQHEWMLMPSDYEVFFLPSQSTDEIVNVMSTIMKFF